MERRNFIKKLITGVGASTLASQMVWAQERVYLTQEQALKLIFPASANVAQLQKELTDEQLKKIEPALGLRLSSRKQTVYQATTNGITDGYAMIMNEVGKDQYITFIVGIGADLKVQRVALMVFREDRGWEVKDARFTNQFRGKSAKSRLLVGADIVGITGATLSARAFCRGTKKALLICQALFQQPI